MLNKTPKAFKFQPIDYMYFKKKKSEDNTLNQGGDYDAETANKTNRL